MPSVRFLSRRRFLFTFLLALLIHGIVWQLWEPQIIHWGEQMANLLRGRPFNQTQVLDSNGLPVQVYRDGSKQYNPLFIAVKAKQDFVHREEAASRKSFLNLSQWLLDNAVHRDSILLLPYNFDFPKFGMRAPWTSGLAQAVTMRVFAQRASIDANPVWKDAFHATLRSLLPGSQHTITLPDSSLWFMEYPGTSAPYALSGMISTLLQIRYCYNLTREPVLSELFDRGYRAVIAKLPGFDRHGFSIYSLDGTLNGRNYHQRYYQRLLQLDAIRPHPSLRYYAKRWKNHDLLPVLIQLVYNPRPRRVAAVLGTLLLLWALLMLACYLFYRLGRKRRSALSKSS
jgi:hypothetical protein